MSEVPRCSWWLWDHSYRYIGDYTSMKVGICQIREVVRCDSRDCQNSNGLEGNASWPVGWFLALVKVVAGDIVQHLISCLRARVRAVLQVRGD